jgi:glutathione S-transferase
MPNTPYTLYGLDGSSYTGKVRAYMRHQNVPFRERSVGHPVYGAEIVPKIGRVIMPVVVADDGAIIQDSADILDYFEDRNFGNQSIIPDNPIIRAIAHLFEFFGGEGMVRPLMHYRWSFDAENLPLTKSFFADMSPATKSAKELEEMFEFASGRMRGATSAFGVAPETMKDIEATSEDFLKRFDAHLAESSFLLGGHATIGDFGLAIPLYAHLSRDAYPGSLMKRIAPRVFKWVERLNGPETYEDHRVSWQSEELFGANTVPETLKDLMRYVSEEYLSEITAHVAYANNWLADRPDIKPGTNGLDDPAQRGIGMAEFNWRGHEIKTLVMPYRFYLLQRLTDCVDQAGAEDQKAIRALFAETGLDPILDLRTTRRVERANHLEVWGE